SGASHRGSSGSRGKIARNRRKTAKGATYRTEGDSRRGVAAKGSNRTRALTDLAHERPDLVLLCALRAVLQRLFGFQPRSVLVAPFQQRHRQMEMEGGVLRMIL